MVNTKKEIYRIALSGGPCAGKTTALAKLIRYLVSRGFKVFVIPETFTEMFSGGILLKEYPNVEFQDMLLKLSLTKEAIYERAANLCKDDKVVIIYDRGTPDGLAYMSKEDREELLRRYTTTAFDLKNTYDGVVFMVTAADGAPEAYLANQKSNPARDEKLHEAIAADRALQKVWTGHPHMRVIGNDCEFHEKIHHVLQAVASFLGIPEPLEIERKYLIKMPDITELEKRVNVSKLNIIQTYLCDDGSGSERRLRMFSEGDEKAYRFFYTEKRDISPGKRVEVERPITQEEYNTLLMQSAPEKRQIRKTRYCFIHAGQYFELDVYPFWDDRAILEIELISDATPVNIPDFIDVLKDVTGEKTYSNYTLASTIPH